MRAMVRQRDARFRREKNASERLGKGNGKGSGSVARTLVFFGCRHASRDFLYAEEWAALAARGTLRGDRDDEGVDESVDDLDDAFVPVFSRDGDRKRYVSHAVRDRSKSVWDVLRRDRSAVVICGSSGAMPEDVHESLVDVCARERDGIAPFVRKGIVGAGGRPGYAVGGVLHSVLKFRDTALQDGDVLVRIRELPARLGIVVPCKHQRGVQLRVRRCRLIAQGSGQEKLPRVLRG